ncbi:MAG: desulfoferrodoxin [Selenomonadaceae bacterium]|nr:desulfoferrodoxin [Selenomonadaceae bacterium]
MSGGRIFISEDKQTLIMLINRGTGELFCNGKPMNPLPANTTDAAQEKHVPVVEVSGNKVSVKVGSVAHPMTEAHLIEWIYLQTKKGGQYRHLTPSDKPEADFLVAEGDTPIAVYEYCNLHGLWKADI